jgi:3-hydroxyacyl-CoA dehydrogenase
MDPLGVGIVGSGFMGRTYAETIARYCPQASLKAVTGYRLGRPPSGGSGPGRL